jgi:alpha-L-rhamnosidase
MNSGHLLNEFSEQSCLRLLGIMLCLALPLTGAASQSGDLALENLRCEYRVDPVGIDVVLPRLSWTLASGQRGQRQTAFQVLVASSPAALARNGGDRWDSGRVSSDQTVHVVYAGQPLESRMRA